MSKPMSLRQFRRVARKYGLPFEVLPGATTRNRNHVGAWGPVHGLFIHHTGDDATDAADLAVIRDGRAGLPGPLAQFGCPDNGRIAVVGWGRANHAGGGDPRVLAAVRDESYGDYPPAPHEHTGSAGAADGNTHFYGVETFYSGSHRPTRAARRSLILLAAAICDHHGWTAKSVIGHKEWSDWKSDPGSVDMRSFRAQVQAVMDAANAPSSPAAPVASADPIEGWDRMIPLRDQLADLLGKTRNRERRGRITAALEAIEGK